MDRYSSSPVPSLATHDGLQTFDQGARDRFIGQGESLKVLHDFMTFPRALGLDIIQHKSTETNRIYECALTSAISCVRSLYT